MGRAWTSFLPSTLLSCPTGRPAAPSASGRRAGSVSPAPPQPAAQLCPQPPMGDEAVTSVGHPGSTLIAPGSPGVFPCLVQQPLSVRSTTTPQGPCRKPCPSFSPSPATSEPKTRRTTGRLWGWLSWNALTSCSFGATWLCWGATPSPCAPSGCFGAACEDRRRPLSLSVLSQHWGEAGGGRTEGGCQSPPVPGASFRSAQVGTCTHRAAA